MAATFPYGFEYTSETGAAAEIIKTFYLDGIREAHYKATPLLSRLERQLPKKMIGTAAVFPVKWGFDPGSGPVVTEGGAVPAAGKISRDQATVPIKELAHSIALSNKLIACAKGDPFSFVDAVTDKVTNASESFNYQCDRQLWGDGSGFLCEMADAAVGGSVAGYVIPVDYTSDLRLLFDGMYVDIMDDSSTTQYNNGVSYHAKVSAIVNSTASASASTGPRFTITLQSGTTWTAAPASQDCILAATNDLSVSRTYDHGATSSNTYVEMMGLQGIISNADPTTGDLQGLDRATYTQWQSNVRSASSNRPLTIKLMIQAAQDCSSRGGDPTAIYCDMDQLLSYSQLLTPDVRYTNLQDLTGGFKGLAFSFGGSKEIPIFGCKQCTPNRMYFVDESHLFFVQTGDIEWLPGAQGNGMLTWDIGYAQKVGMLEWFANLATDHPGSSCALTYLENPV